MLEGPERGLKSGLLRERRSNERSLVARNAAKAWNYAFGAALKRKPREVREVRPHCAIGAGVPASVFGRIEDNKRQFRRRCKQDFGDYGT